LSQPETTKTISERRIEAENIFTSRNLLLL
jgi:hypothetical protein